MAVVHDPVYGSEIQGGAHDRDRARRILAFLVSEGLLAPGRVLRPRAASLRELRRVHDDAYLASLEDPASLLPVLGFRPTREQHDAYLEVHRAAVGGTLLATDRAVAHRATVIHLGGGFHHASRDRGQGFCVFNDVAAAIAEARGRGLEAGVLVIDLDLHDGDGTRALFADDPTVHTFSIHNHHLGTVEARESTSLALGEAVGDRAYLDALRSSLPPVLARFRPGLAFYLAGADPAAGDRLGNWQVSASGLLERDRFVVSSLRDLRADLPVVILLAGGYGASAWRYSARFFAWLLGRGEVIEPPPTEELTLARYRRLSRELRPTDLVRSGGDGWTLTEEDLLESLVPARQSTRFLGFYSRHGIELVLERSGLGDRLRSLGFESLTVVLELDDPVEHTVRILADPRGGEPLVELRARRDATTVRGMELLRVEWLLLQNPRASFTPERPPLPGQRHPGLGLLKEVMALLIVVCERLGLDGIVFTPSHYHLAVQSRRLLRFLDPRDEARFRALRAAVADLGLAEASRAVHEGRVEEVATGRAAEWRPAPMVLPIRSRMKHEVESEEYERAVAAAARGLAFRLGSGGGGGDLGQ